MNAKDHKIRILTEPEHLEGLAVCDRCHGGEIDLETPCVERLATQVEELKNKLKANPIAKLRAVVSRQDENENDDRIDTLYAALREAVITLFQNPEAEV